MVQAALCGAIPGVGVAQGGLCLGELALSAEHLGELCPSIELMWVILHGQSCQLLGLGQVHLLPPGQGKVAVVNGRGGELLHGCGQVTPLLLRRCTAQHHGIVLPIGQPSGCQAAGHGCAARDQHRQTEEHQGTPGSTFRPNGHRCAHALFHSHTRVRGS